MTLKRKTDLFTGSVAIFTHCEGEQSDKNCETADATESFKFDVWKLFGFPLSKHKWRKDGQKEQHTVTAHFTWSVVNTLLLIATVIFFHLLQVEILCLFSYIDAVSCWQKRGRNLSAAFNSEVHKKIEL